jgi:DNA-binding response OmpR family regulator
MTPKPVVLIVDRDADCRDLYCTYLACEGFECVAVDDGEIALRVMRERLPDVVLIDAYLPSVSGWDVVWQVKADPLMRSSRIVMFTSGAYPQDRERAAAIGADAFVPKPAAPDEVAEILRALLEAQGPNPNGTVQ